MWDISVSENLFESMQGEKLENLFKDESAEFLPKLPPFNKTYSAVAKGHR